MSDDSQPDRASQPDPADPKDDERLLDDLRAAAPLLDPVPEDALLAARSMLAHLRLDAELAELTFDSLLDEPLIGVRSQTPAIRRLAFATDDAEVEIEVISEGDDRRLVGQCVPAMEVELTLHRRDGGGAPAPRTPWLESATDSLGRFAIEVPRGPVNLRCRWVATGRVVETSWVSV